MYVDDKNKIVCLWSSGADPDAISAYSLKGYRIVSVTNGGGSLHDAVKQIIVSRITHT